MAFILQSWPVTSDSKINGTHLQLFCRKLCKIEILGISQMLLHNAGPIRKPLLLENQKQRVSTIQFRILRN